MNLEEMYRPFGPEVLREIRTQTALHGSIGAVLKKLNIPSGPSVESQHVALRNFIYQYGVAFFLSAVQSEFSTEDIERMKTRRLMQLSRQERRQGPKAYKSVNDVKHEVEAQHTGHLPTGGTAPAPPPAGTPLRRKTDRSSDQSAPAPAVPASSPSDQDAAPAQQQATTGPYSGRDRRVRQERRQHDRKRRQDLQVVFKNKRYGGDRRKEIRRRADREGPKE